MASSATDTDPEIAAMAAAAALAPAQQRRVVNWLLSRIADAEVAGIEAARPPAGPDPAPPPARSDPPAGKAGPRRERVSAGGADLTDEIERVVRERGTATAKEVAAELGRDYGHVRRLISKDPRFVRADPGNFKSPVRLRNG